MSFSIFQKKKENKNGIPYKSSINLVTKPNKKDNIRSVLTIMLILLILLSVFVKLGIYDRLSARQQTVDALNNARLRLSQIVDSNTDYQEILSEYEKYMPIPDEDIAVYPPEILKLAKELFLFGKVEHLSVSGNSLKFTLYETNLIRLSQLISYLKDYPIVSDITLNNVSDTFNSREDSSCIAHFSLTLTEGDAT